mmetsp:Transcript_68649/g.162844  ORF Transcript_68649/g.162844 Transcript_68649/m.162844 type:complete len:256 (+) Transcript_68649:354-1121(+)
MHSLLMPPPRDEPRRLPAPVGRRVPGPLGLALVGAGGEGPPTLPRLPGVLRCLFRRLAREVCGQRVLACGGGLVLLQLCLLLQRRAPPDCDRLRERALCLLRALPLLLLPLRQLLPFQRVAPLARDALLLREPLLRSRLLRLLPHRLLLLDVELRAALLLLLHALLPRLPLPFLLLQLLQVTRLLLETALLLKRVLHLKSLPRLTLLPLLHLRKPLLQRKPPPHPIQPPHMLLARQRLTRRHQPQPPLVDLPQGP